MPLIAETVTGWSHTKAFFLSSPFIFFLKTQLYEMCTRPDFQVIRLEINCLKTTNNVCLGGFVFYFVRLRATELNLGIVGHMTNIIFPVQVYMYKY